MKLSIVTPVYNKCNFTKQYLQDVSNLRDTEIIIIDNGSTDNTSDIVNSFTHTCALKYIKLDTNKGFGAANNIGFKEAIGDYVLFLNNDIKVKSNHQNWTDNFYPWMDKGLVGPTMGRLDNNFNFMYEKNEFIEDPLGYMSGWCVGASKEMWKKSAWNIEKGLIWNQDCLAYFEDDHLSFKAKMYGVPFKIIDIPVAHFGKITSSLLNTSYLYTEAKNNFIKIWKNKINKLPKTKEIV